MRRYVDGDEAAFAALFSRYSARVERRMRRFAGDSVAADLTQQTFLQLHRARRDFRQGLTLRPWLMTIAQNVLRDHLRRVARTPRRVTLMEDPRSESAPRPLEIQETREAVRAAVRELPESQQTVVRRQWIEHRSHVDIASELGITRGAVKVRAHRAYRTLRRLLSDRGFESR